MTRDEFDAYVNRFPNGSSASGNWTGWLVHTSHDGTLVATNTFSMEEAGVRFVAAATVSESELLQFIDSDIDRPLVTLLEMRRREVERLMLQARAKKKGIILP